MREKREKREKRENDSRARVSHWERVRRRGRTDCLNGFAQESIVGALQCRVGESASRRG